MMKHFALVVALIVLCGCAKNASETATETSLNQVSVIEQQIKKECPTAKFDEQMNALRDSIKNQLAVCEAEKGTLRERNNTLIVVLFGILVVFGVSKLAKRGL